MGIESRINYILNKNPALKRKLKRVYQTVVCGCTKHSKAEGNIKRVSPKNDSREYFFGYYDKSPWDQTDRYMLCIRANRTWDDVSPRERADIILIDTRQSSESPWRIQKIAETSAWNVQQGCMLQWLGPDYSQRVIYNDCRDGQYVSVILNILNGKERVIDAPIYTVASDGKTALTLDFSRLYNLRPGYGYYNVPEKTQGIGLPDATAIWKINLETGEIRSLLTYRDFADFQPRREMLERSAVHKVNHLMLSPDGKRFMVLYRWFVGQRKYTRLITCNIDGSEMYLLSDDDMVSHCFWKDNETILAFENKKPDGIGYYIMKDRTQAFQRCWRELGNDGHPSYSPDGRLVVTDTYPDRARISSIYLMSGKNEPFGKATSIAKVYSPFKYDNDTRCDLHPRWNRAGNKICFDGVFEGHRGLYTISLEAGKKIKIVYLLTSCKKTGPVQQTLNIIDHLDKERFEPVLVTLYPEDRDGTSQLPKFKKICRHLYAPTSKPEILLGRTSNLTAALEHIQPDIIHSLGVFPDYVISRLQKYPQVITLRNYVWDDYPAKFGRIQGAVLARLQLYAMKRADVTVACSKSLSQIYAQKLSLHYGFIRNGVDMDKYNQVPYEEKQQLRRKLRLPRDAFIFIYTGQMIERKNVKFLAEVFEQTFHDENVLLLLLGDGAEYPELLAKYKNSRVMRFTGNVLNVREYLNASDVYVSTSKSEGMPNGVLEAMASGLAVILSDIEQHKEIFEENNQIGYLYKQDDKEDLSRALRRMTHADIGAFSKAAYDSARLNFSAAQNCEQYQKIYEYLKPQG